MKLLCIREGAINKRKILLSIREKNAECSEMQQDVFWKDFV